MCLFLKMVWGKLTIINLYQCEPSFIRNKNKIKEFIEKLCLQINMKKHGEPIIKRFGKNKLKGFSVLQFIKTSSITIHFDEIQNRAFIDVFCCKNFDLKKAEKFSKEFFKAKKSKLKTILRK